MVLLDLDDVTWMPLLLVGVVGVVMYLLYLSMRRHINRIHVPDDDRPGADGYPHDEK